MYLHKVRKSPLDGFNVNLSFGQMVAVLVLFVLFFVAPILTVSKLQKSNSNPRVAGAQTSVYKNSNEKTQLLKITTTAAVGSSVLLIATLGVFVSGHYKRNKNYEL